MARTPVDSSLTVDILVISAHPDDAELGCGGTIIRHVRQGVRVGLIDLTAGEMGSRGDAATRLEEARKAADIMGITFRENLGLPDAFFEVNKETRLLLVHKIRQYRPQVIITSAPGDRHPDHDKTARLVKEAVFWAGMHRIPTPPLPPHRPHTILGYMHADYVKPDLLVDIEAVIDQKMAAVRAYASQFHIPDSNAPETFLSQPGFLRAAEGRAYGIGLWGHRYAAEGFVAFKIPVLNNLLCLE